MREQASREIVLTLCDMDAWHVFRRTNAQELREIGTDEQCLALALNQSLMLGGGAAPLVRVAFVDDDHTESRDDADVTQGMDDKRRDQESAAVASRGAADRVDLTTHRPEPDTPDSPMWNDRPPVSLVKSISVFDLYQTRIGELPRDTSLRELPLDSPCGADCAKAITTAAEFLEALAKAFGRTDQRRTAVIDALNDTVGCFWHG